MNAINESGSRVTVNKMADTKESNEESKNKNEKPLEQSNSAPIDDKLVMTAIHFLQNPKVVSRPLSQKKEFLKRKGLTDEQINEALKLSGSLEEFQHQPNLPMQPIQIHHSPSMWMRVRDISVTALIVYSVGFGLHKLYLRYIKPYLFEKEESNLETTLKLLIETMQNVELTLNSVQDKLKELSAVAQSNQNIQKVKELEYYQELKTEVNSIKGLLLNRRSFPPPPNLSSGLPSWQIQQTIESNNSNNVLDDELQVESVENLEISNK